MTQCTVDIHVAAITQIKGLLGRVPADGPVPLFVFDAGYDPVQLALDLGDTRAATTVPTAARAAGSSSA